MKLNEFFKKLYISVAECLDSKAAAILSKNPGDIGEECEVFVKEFLADSFSGRARIFRGGMVVDSNGSQSKQIDIVVCPSNTLKICSDKGLYPIESVYGVFSITKKLDYKKLFSTDPKEGGCIENLKSVGVLDKKFHYIFEGSSMGLPTFEFHKSYHPYKCVFGYSGDINQKWADELNQIIAKDPGQASLLPDLIVVNKKGLIRKDHKNQQAFFQYIDISTTGHVGSPFIMMVHDLMLFLDWQDVLRPEYHLYFNQDMN